MENLVSDFINAIDRYAKGDLSLQDLITVVQRALKAQPELTSVLTQQLTSCFNAKKISPEAYFSLKTLISDKENETVSSADDETIRVVPTVTTLEDETLVAYQANASTEDTVLNANQLNREDDVTQVLTQESPTILASDVTTDATLVTTASTTQTARTVQSTHTFSPTTSGMTTTGGTKFDRQPLGVGSILKDRFILEEVLGSGGMGVVYKALDLRKQEAQDKSPYVALKILNDDIKNDTTAFIALQRETKKAQTLAHPNIITVYDFDRDLSHVFMSMEILTGQSLSSFITKQAPNGLPFKQAWPMINGLCQALAYAHKHGIVHSDFKPGNVAVNEAGEVKVLDFGIACAVSRHDKESDETVFDARRDLGALTPAYASLEMFSHSDPDPSDDVYALACVSYELLCGKHPYGKLSSQKAFELKLQPKAIPGLSRRQWKALLHGLAFEKKNRTPTVTKFMEELGPKSSLPMILSAVAVIAVLGSGGYMYKLSKEKVDPLEEKIIALTPEQQLKVKDFLELAQMHTDVGYLTAPTGSNAVWAYRQALDIDPYNKEAKQGLEKIANIVMQEAEKLYADGKSDQSLTKVEEGLEALPKHEGLLALKDKIIHNN